MNKRNKKLMMIFLMGVLATAFVLPLLSSLGVPSYSVVLVALFEEGSMWALALSLVLILSTTLGVMKGIKNYA
ncbi:hypothetical protein [Cytobacillus gottheilii]|uniref:hypothetical protein n=1 Tax=Cytobacillus gottheilii TaxID=859144 RepID=UPI0009BAFCE5|nr:hypothetical protein [Cytobacillus gottheilii]